MANDPQTYFNTTLPALLVKDAAVAKKANARFAFNISGPTGGQWYVDLTAPSVAAGAAPSSVPAASVCAVALADTDFPTLLTGTLQDMLRLKVSGKLKLSGNTLVSVRLQALFALS